MANTRELVIRRKSVQNTRKITKTMEMVATAKLQRAQQSAVESRPYAQTLREAIGDLASAAENVDHPLLKVHDPLRKTVVIVITSDRGLCAAFNTNILREARDLLDRLNEQGREIELIAIGKKAVSTLSFWGMTVDRAITGVSDKPTFEAADEIASDLIARYGREEVDEAFVVYSEFRSMVLQAPTVEQFMPLSAITTGDEEEGKNAAGVDYLFHPDPKSILEQVLPLVVKMSVFNAMLQSAAGEHAARRVAMKNATDAADDMIKMITRLYNRARQAKITQEIAEIVAGADVQ